MDQPASGGQYGSQGPPGVKSRASYPSSPRLLDLETRRYLLKVAARWSPLAICTAALGLIVALAAPIPGATGQLTTNQAGPASTRSGRSILRGSHLRSSSSSLQGSNYQAGSSSSSGGYSSTLGSGGSSGSAGYASSSGPTSNGTSSSGSASSGVAVTGIKCGPGVRQFSWSVYAPNCVPAFHGNNGGATAHGVTPTTITLSYAIPNSAQQSAVESLAGSAFPNDPAYIQDMQTYIKFFNTQYELYGRKVVLKTFQAQGDYLEEDQGEDLQGAQADAATAYSLGAFADVTFPLFSAQPYQQDLAEQHIIAMGGTYMPQSWYEQYAPYEYSAYTPTGTNSAKGLVNTVCQRMAGMNAIFSPQYSSTVRKFGLITPVNPVYMDDGNDIQNGLSKCGVSIAKRESYSINLTTFEQQATSMVAQMKAAGVTTVICGCDPLIPIFMSKAADQQDYYPEWLTDYWGDPDTRNFAQDQWDHALSNGPQYPVNSQTEAYKAFQLADHGNPPAEQYYYVAYETLIQLFAGLQAAGPDLTPQSFEQGMFSLPPSEGNGEFGTWVYGQDVFDPVATGPVSWWSPSATSNFDGKQGAWQACDGGKWYPFDDQAAYGGPRQQLNCFGH